MTIDQQNLIDNYKNPLNNYTMENYTFMHRQVNTSCGDDITVYIKIEDGLVIDCSFIGQGCSLSIGIASMISEWMKGKYLLDLVGINDVNYLEKNFLNFSISPSRYKCITLFSNAIKNALDKSNI